MTQSRLPLDPGEGAGLSALLRHAPPPDAGAWDELRQAGLQLRPGWQHSRSGSRCTSLFSNVLICQNGNTSRFRCAIF